MTRTSFVSTVAVLAALVVGGIALRSWLEAHDARLQMQATLEAQKQVIVAAGQREQQRAAELKDTLAQVAELKRQVQTPQQIIRELPQYLPLPQPIQLAPSGSAQATPAPGTRAQQGSGVGATAPASGRANAAASSETSSPTPEGSNAPVQGEVNAPAPAGANPSGQSAGNATPAVQFPVEDLKPLYDFVQDCRACKAQLDAARADLTDERARSDALAKERDAAIKALDSVAIRPLTSAKGYYVISCNFLLKARRVKDAYRAIQNVIEWVRRCPFELAISLNCSRARSPRRRFKM